MTLRTDLLGDLSFPTGAYLYSDPIDIPVIPNTDFLFKSDLSATIYLPLIFK